MLYYTGYRLLTILLSPLIIGYLLWLSITNRHADSFWQRLGFVAPLPEAGCLWFHCASVGEVNTLLPLLRRLHHLGKAQNILVTTNTITGARIVQQQKLPYLHHRYLPFDWRHSVKRFIKRIRPSSLWVMETELWPTLFRTCHQRQIPLATINARLSGKSRNAGHWVRSLLGFCLQQVDAIHARSDDDRDAYRRLGAEETITQTTGNMKLLSVINTDDGAKRTGLTREYVLVASTHDDEEENIYRIWQSLSREELLLIAPRHPERRQRIIKNLNCDRLALRSADDVVDEHTQVYLLDTVGELKTYFAAAKLVIMGGSFVPVGGHNILEPASYHSAIITGPCMDNFSQELDLLRAHDAIVQLATVDELEARLPELLDDASRRSTLQDNTRKLSHDAEAVLGRYTSLFPDRHQ